MKSEDCCTKAASHDEPRAVTKKVSEKRWHERFARRKTMAYSIFSTEHWMQVHTQSVNVSRKGVSFVAKEHRHARISELFLYRLVYLSFPRCC
jgi:hypothetical protein